MKTGYVICKRRCQTLIEVLIAMVLMVIILMTLNFFYQHVDSLNTEMEKVQTEAFQMRYLEGRLAAVLTAVQSPSGAPEDFYFFTSSSTGSLMKAGNPSLVFIFGNHVDLDKERSNNILGRLYLDSKNRFCLATWPSPKRWEPTITPAIKREILMENVESLKMEFFVPPEKARKGEKKNAAEAVVGNKMASLNGEWVKEWQSDFQEIPVMIKIEIVRKVDSGKEKDKREHRYVFMFPLPHAEKTIVYDK